MIIMVESTVNAQVTDSVTQVNTEVLGQAAGHSMGILFEIAAHAGGMAMQNAVSNQQNINQLNAAIIAEAIKIITGK
jgi:hypothetical protein